MATTIPSSLGRLQARPFLAHTHCPRVSLRSARSQSRSVRQEAHLLWGVWDDVSTVRPHVSLRATADEGGAVEGAAATEVVPTEETLGEVESFEVDSAEEPVEETRQRTPRGQGSPLEDIVEGEMYEGTVVGVTGFGAFVDIGAEKDCLVHISQLSQDFIQDPGQVVFKGMAVKVLILGVDLNAARIKGSFKHSEMNLRSPRNRWDEE